MIKTSLQNNNIPVLKIPNTFPMVYYRLNFKRAGPKMSSESKQAGPGLFRHLYAAGVCAPLSKWGMCK